MKYIMIDSFKGASGKICGHSDMGATYNSRTGLTYSHKLCNKRDLDALPYTEREISQHSSFKTRSRVVSQTIKSLTDEQRKALILLRNQHRLYSFRQLIDGIYDKETETVPASALADLIAKAKTNSTLSDGDSQSGNQGGNQSGSQGGSSSGNVTLTVTAGNGGKVQIGNETASNNVSKSVAPGTQLTIKATANPGYGFDRWSDGQSGATRTITVNSDMSLTASFLSTDDE